VAVLQLTPVSTRKVNPPRKRRLALAGLGLLLVVIVAVALVGWRLYSTVSAAIAEADLARTQLLSGAHVLKTAGLGMTKPETAQAATDFQAAEQHFAHVHQVFSQSRLLGVLGALPLAGTQVKAATDLSDIGIHAARSGELFVGVVADAASKEGSAPAPGEKVLAILNALDPRLDQLGTELDVIARDRTQIPSKGLLPQLANAVKQFDSKLDLATVNTGLATLRADEPALRELLGAAGTRSYLVLQQDPAELRATGGFIGSVGFLTFDHGKMAPFTPVDSYSIDWDIYGRSLLGPPGTKSHVDLPAPIHEAFPTVPSWELRDSNWSPDFPTAAHQAESFLLKENGRHVDGVIAIDPYFIASLLKIVGPITVPETGDTVTADNFFLTTLKQVQLTKATTHKSFLSQAAKVILPKVLSMPTSKWPAALQALNSGCEGRSLQANVHDARVQKLISQYRCTGEALPWAADGAMINASNLGANKDDFWLSRSYQLEIAMNSDGSARHTLRLHYYGLTHQDVRLTQYLPYAGWLRVYVPPSSKIVSIAGAKLDPAGDLNRTVVQGWFHVGFNSTTDITIVYDVGAAVMRAQNGRVDFTWQKQAGRPNDEISVTFIPPPGGKVRGIHIGSDAKAGDSAKSDLAVDRQFSFNYSAS
jgi:hypothetical protein